MDVLSFLLGLCIGILIMALVRIAILFKMMDEINKDNRKLDVLLTDLNRRLEQIRKYCSVKEWE